MGVLQDDADSGCRDPSGTLAEPWTAGRVVTATGRQSPLPVLGR
jgi:hypothetical protein